MPAGKKKETPAPDTELTFEAAVGKLERIVGDMENEQLPLEDIVTRYESASALLKHCETVLSAARERIELITLSADGEMPAGKQTPQETETGDTDDDNDISLFR